MRPMSRNSSALRNPKQKAALRRTVTPRRVPSRRSLDSVSSTRNSSRRNRSCSSKNAAPTIAAARSLSPWNSFKNPSQSSRCSFSLSRIAIAGGSRSPNEAVEKVPKRGILTACENAPTFSGRFEHRRRRTRGRDLRGDRGSVDHRCPIQSRTRSYRIVECR